MAVNVPLAILLTGVAVKLVQLGLALTDSMSATVAQGAGLDTDHFFGSTITASSGPATGGPATPTFVVLMGGLAVVFGAFLLWVELLIRSAAIYVVVLFLPLALASLAWPAIAHWCRRLVNTLVALILGTFVIVSVLSLAAGALAGGSDRRRPGRRARPPVKAASPMCWEVRLCCYWRPSPPGPSSGCCRFWKRERWVISKAPVGGASQTALGPPKAAGPAGHAGGGRRQRRRRRGRIGHGVGPGRRRRRVRAGGGETGSGSGSPDLGRSSLEKLRIGTATPPGASVPKRSPHPGVGETYTQVMQGGGPSEAARRR